ncbi:hypothetical protein ACFL1X_04235, partial [Candidatus Hydrogenedentota bacterium]
SYVAAAEAMGLDFSGLVNRLVDVAAARYFGMSQPELLAEDRRKQERTVFSYLTQNRDKMEARVQQWVNVSSRTTDPVGLDMAEQMVKSIFEELGLQIVPDLSGKSIMTWETSAGMKDGILLICQLDTPVNPDISNEPFRRTPTMLFGEGAGLSRAPLTCIEFALRAIRRLRRLKSLKVGVVIYSDEGRNYINSGAVIRKCMDSAEKILVIAPGNEDNAVVVQRRGYRNYRLVIEGMPARLGAAKQSSRVMQTLFEKLIEMEALSSRSKRLAVALKDLKTESHSLLLPHRATANLEMSFLASATADKLESDLKELFSNDRQKWSFKRLNERPPYTKTRENEALLAELCEVAESLDLPLNTDSSLLPSVAGLASGKKPVLCGVGPVARNLYTSRESVSRISLIQRTLLLAEYLLATANVNKSSRNRKMTP